MANPGTYFSGRLRIGGGNRGIIFLQKRSRLSLLFSLVSAILLLSALVIVLLPSLPQLIYRIRPNTSDDLARILARPAVTFGDLLAVSGDQESQAYQPPFEPSLPESAWIRIPKIGVDTGIIEAPQERFEDALKRGVWRVPDFGTPEVRRLPTILVAHRFGYLSWSDNYRKQHSFYNLPKLVPGDRVEIIWQQRRYVYEIYSDQEGELMEDYTADLTLYTCRLLTSPIRIFRYAKLVREER